MDEIADWGVYVVPPEDHPLYRVCASVLGWDCRREVAVQRPTLAGITPALLEAWVGPAAAYGPHGTLSGWMSMARQHRQRIVHDLAMVASSFAPIRLERARFAAPGDYWYPRTAPAPVLVVVFDDPLGALRSAHAEVLVRFNRLATRSLFDEQREQRGYTARHQFRIDRYHEPRVLEDFEFHVTFASRVPSADAADRLRRAIVDATGLFSQADHTTWMVDSLWLFERRPDGFWRMAEEFPLGG